MVYIIIFKEMSKLINMLLTRKIIKITQKNKIENPMQLLYS